MSSGEQWLSDHEHDFDDVSDYSDILVSDDVGIAKVVNVDDGSPQKRTRSRNQGKPNKANKASKSKKAKNDDMDSDAENNVAVNAKNLSPLKGQYAAQYARSVKSVSDKAIEEAQQRVAPMIVHQAGTRKMDATELKNLVIKKTQQPLAKQYAVEFEKIRQFIEDFLNDPHNYHATIKAYNHKMNYFIAEEKRIMAELDARHQLLEDSLKTASMSASIAHITRMMGEIEFDKQDAESKIAMIERKQAAGSEPLCVSFVVVRDQAGERDIIIIGISSPEKNPELYERFQQFAAKRLSIVPTASSSSSATTSATTSSGLSALAAFRVAMQGDSYVVADPASLDYQKFMQQVADQVGATHPSDPLKECAEKSYFSLLTKLYELKGDQLDIKMICNFAFLPKLKQQDQVKDKNIDIKIKSDIYTMSLIDPCQDCDKNMAVHALLLYGAASGQVTTSPVKSKTKASMLATLPRLPTTQTLFGSDEKAKRNLVGQFMELSDGPTVGLSASGARQ